MRVVLAEDLYLLRTGLERLLAACGFEVIESVDNGPALLRALVDKRPDVAVVDIRLPPTFTDEGLKAAMAARREVPGLPVLLLSAHVEQLYAQELLADQAGAVGYLLKDRVFNDDQFTDAVRAVASGGTAGAPATSPSPGYPPASARSSPSWPRAVRTARSRSACSSRTRRWASTARRSSPSSTSPRPTTTTAGSSRCWHI
jgi:DNA-binding NarL/FixJ family response regulator